MCARSSRARRARRSSRRARRAGRSRAAWPARAAGARDGVQVLRPPAAVPPEPHLRARRRARSTAPRWPAGSTSATQLLDPLVAALGRYVLAGDKVHADDTPVPVLDPGAGRTKTGRLWVYVRDDRPAGSTDAAGGLVPLLARPQGRASAEPPARASAASCRPTPTVAGASSTTSGARRRSGVLGARARPWWDLYLSHGRRRRARLPPRRCSASRALYDDRGRDPRPAAGGATRAAPGARRAAAGGAARVARAACWASVSAKSELAKAIGYTPRALEGADALRGRRPHRDRQQRRRARAARRRRWGASNYLFMGSDAGGERAAAIYSLVETAKLNGLDPRGLPARGARAHRRPSDQPHRRVAAVEHRRDTASQRQAA